MYNISHICPTVPVLRLKDTVTKWSERCRTSGALANTVNLPKDEWKKEVQNELKLNFRWNQCYGVIDHMLNE